ncbi:MAG: InlB B-repeat-containing protein [Planctomycetota bacterium]|jgi:pyrrolidone-carboxylate peptidase
MLHRKFCTILLCALLLSWTEATSFAANTRNIMLTGYWPPSNEMLRKFSTDPNQNPGGWQGENWEGLGYNIYAYFPEFPGGVASNPKGEGDFEIDYQDVSSDFEQITADIHPIAILSYGEGAASWELEYNARNLTSWNGDFLDPFGPTPSPPDSSKPAGYIHNSTLPVQAITDAINNSGAGVNTWVDRDGDPGAFLCEYLAYQVAWYQELHSDPCDQYRCLAAGLTHVPSSLSVSTATTVCEIALRTTIDYLDSQLTFFTISGTITSDGTPLDGVIMNGLPGSPVTDADGFYTAEVGSGWSGTVAPIKEGYEFDLPELTYSDVDINQPSQDYAAFAAVPQTIEFDNTSSYSSSTTSTTFSWLHTIDSGDDRILIVSAVSGDNLAMDQVISSVKYDGFDMTRLSAASESRGYVKTDMYYMLEADLPTVPGSYTVSITYNGNISTLAGGAVSLKNVKQQVPEAVTSNSLYPASSISTNINTFSSGVWIVDIVGHSKNGSFSTSTSMEQWDEETGIITAAAGTTQAASAGPAAVSWDFSGDDGTILHSLAAFAPAQAAAPARSLTTSSTDGGDVTVPGEGTFQYDYDTVVDIVATPQANYRFVSWAGSGVTAGNVADPNSADTTINIDENYTVHASFEQLPSDNFNDNRRNAIWRSSAEDYSKVAVVEDANQLNLNATGEAGYLIADYVANGWSFEPNGNFEIKADYHYSDVSEQDGWIGITIENNNGFISISAGSDSSGRYFYYEKVADGNTAFEQTTRDSNDGTLYISYNASVDELYLSYTGYGSVNAWKTLSGLLQGQWASEPVSLAIGGGSDSVVLEAGEAYLDNFEVTTAIPIGLPPTTDLNSDGFIDWDDVWKISENWLNTGPEGDVNKDGSVDFKDYAELTLAW